MAYRTWTDSQLSTAITSSITITEVIKKLNLKSRNSGNYQTVRRKIRELNIDTSHFKEASVGAHNTSKKPLLEVLVENSTYSSSQNLKSRLIKEGVLEEKCYECGIDHWRRRKLSLHLDHINGVNSDNRIDNLRLLCPNCHSLTPTYCRGTRVRRKNTCECGVEISSRSYRCRECNFLQKKRQDSLCSINWPSADELMKLVKKLGYSKVGRSLGVSDNAVRKRIKTRSPTN